MHRALKVIGCIGLVGLVAVGARLLRNYHSAGTIFPFPLREDDKPLFLPEAKRGKRVPTRDEVMLIEAAGEDGWPTAGNMTFRTEAGLPYLRFVIENDNTPTEIHLAFGAGGQSTVVHRYDGPGKEDVWGTHLTFSDFKKIRGS